MLNTILKDNDKEENEQQSVILNGFNVNRDFIKNPLSEEQRIAHKTVSLIIILLIIKANEFGHTKCAGYLIKVLCSNVEPEFINDALFDVQDGLIKNNDVSLSMFKDNQINKRLLNELNIDFHFSKLSIKYCFDKTVFLLLGQIVYIQDKVSDLHKEYGLIYLKKTGFLNSYVS
ncbi:hypothetical protein E2R55_27180 [Vibrio vulnificus]|nr:hypothetical protein E2R55_27180 [Vibrio vulnificus]